MVAVRSGALQTEEMNEIGTVPPEPSKNQIFFLKSPVTSVSELQTEGKMFILEK